MPTVPDFTFKQNFPIESVIAAAQQNAQRQLQARTQGQDSLIEGLKAIGQVGSSLVAQKQRIASALAVGRALGIPDEQSRAIGNPEDVIKTATAQSGQGLDLSSLAGTAHALGLPVPGNLTSPQTVQPSPVLNQPSPQGPSVAPGMGGQSLPGIPDSFSVAPSTMAPSSPPPPAPLSGKVSPKQLGMMTKLFPANVPTMTGQEALRAGSVPKDAKIINPSQGGAIDQKEQDRLEGQAINRVATLRGDQSLARTENQRDASIQAYNTITQIKSENRLPSQIEYFDILGQMWKARTGSSPTDQAIRDLDAKTFQGDLGKAQQYFTGKPAGRTTTAVLDNIQDFAKQSGVQADKLHNGYWQTHLVKPSNLSESRWAPIKETAHGMSFKEGTSGGPLIPQASAAPQLNPDLAHLSTKELMDLRNKMTAHKEKNQ